MMCWFPLKTPDAPSCRAFFHAWIWPGSTSYRAAKAALEAIKGEETVAALALKDALCFLRSFDMSYFSSTATAVHVLGAEPSLRYLSENPGPPHCDPVVRTENNRLEVEGKPIIQAVIAEGENKPYFLKDKGPYTRASSGDRSMTRYELDEIYRGQENRV
ncbi:MAG: hypothetical protein O7C75_18010, partial [Verrucomicrobia bacterium]|nr:hypothetical protein [Verrucomicrobiota bacterium]